MGVGAALLFSMLSIAAARAECRSNLIAPAFTLDVVTPPVTYKLNEATETLSARARENGTALGRGSRLLGLTVNQYDLRIEVAFHRTNDSCAVFESATIAAAPEIEVLADRRFKAGSCQQRAIIDHENEHVRVFREAIAYYEPAMEDTLRRAKLPSALPIGPSSDPESAYAAMIHHILAPVLDAVLARTKAANNLIDTPQHYSAVFRRCDSWD